MVFWPISGAERSGGGEVRGRPGDAQGSAGSRPRPARFEPILPLMLLSLWSVKSQRRVPFGIKSNCRLFPRKGCRLGFFSRARIQCHERQNPTSTSCRIRFAPPLSSPPTALSPPTPLPAPLRVSSYQAAKQRWHQLAAGVPEAEGGFNERSEINLRLVSGRRFLPAYSQRTPASLARSLDLALPLPLSLSLSRSRSLAPLQKRCSSVRPTVGSDRFVDCYPGFRNVRL